MYRALGTMLLTAALLLAANFTEAQVAVQMKRAIAIAPSRPATATAA